MSRHLGIKGNTAVYRIFSKNTAPSFRVNEISSFNVDVSRQPAKSDIEILKSDIDWIDV